MAYRKAPLLVLGLTLGAGCGGQTSTLGDDAGDSAKTEDVTHPDARHHRDATTQDAPEDQVAVEDFTPPRDTSPRDMGLPDTGLPDTGLPDTGLPDTGLPDTGLPDTGTPDTGLPDSPPVDAPPADGSVLPPPPPAEAGPPSTTATNFAIHHLFMGDRDFSGKSDANAWKTMGYNVDGKITTASSTNVCTLDTKDGATANDQVDGVGGIDNSFGANVYDGLITALDASVSTAIDASLAAGDWTEMIDVIGLTSSATQTSTGLSAQGFIGAKFPGTPTFTTADDWPIATSDLLTTTPPFTSTRAFPTAYVASGTWVSGPPGDIDLPLTISAEPFPLTIHQAVITFDHSSADHAARGIVSGVLYTKELVATFTRLAASFGICSGSTLDVILKQIKATQDILSDGTNPPSVACDAISIGFGFTADAIAQPSTAMTVCPPLDPCSPDAGTGCDGGGGGGG